MGRGKMTEMEKIGKSNKRLKTAKELQKVVADFLSGMRHCQINRQTRGLDAPHERGH